MLKAREVAQWLGVSESAIYKWVSENNFPKPYKLGDGDAKRSASRWDREDIQIWLEQRRDT
jgi:predicted DNA-binding transcriptional regulator AlpA